MPDKLPLARTNEKDRDIMTDRNRSRNQRLLISPGACALACLMLIGAARAGFGQETSVKPGINDPFEDPDPAAFVERFETESREIYKYRHAIVAALGLEEGMQVADVGAGTGLFTRLIAPEIGDKGRVFAVDIAQNFLDHITRTCAEAKIENVTAVLCTPRSVELPENSADLVFVCDTYHHFEYPSETLASIRKALRPDGRLVILDFERIKGVSKAWTLGHVRCGRGTVTDEVKDAGFDLVKEIPLMREQFFLVFTPRPAVAESEEE